MAGRNARAWILAASALVVLSGCLDGASSTDGAPVSSGGTTRVVERDTEAPDVFQKSDMGLWDGRPSLGGVWVAYPGVKDPERVIIRNPVNGKFVIGALFRREREMPGPKLQVSSDAAAALEMLAGAPVKLDVTALRREDAPVEVAPAAPVLDQAETIATETLPAAAAPVAAIAPVTPKARPAAAAASAPAAPARPVAAAAQGRHLVQIGIFSVEANARSAVSQLGKAGVKAEVRQESSQGKTFWRVTAGPADAAGRDALLGKVKAAGFKDAYFVSR
ncbi:SPOR domain-containing protein [Falsigemmobacter faecalis]|uniref:SPOR domain-containing protein n=1 Tax=Falsigemmobacter faecalis TaxID=2488730 RepID=A0A3P3DGU7_9RHOB|nr:SPOR domain-containing protein [Falsigemmobacter faecalis]RRH73489.1 SPOR domain-containing protein [Falsigemmobacter faecalis]